MAIDSLYLNSGGVVTGELVSQDNLFVTFSVNGNPYHYPKGDVDRIASTNSFFIPENTPPKSQKIPDQDLKKIEKHLDRIATTLERMFILSASLTALGLLVSILL